MQVLYHPSVKSEDIPKLDHEIARRIETVIVNRLAREPELFGLPLRRGLSGYRKMRVGDYRIIYRVVSRQIRVIAIGHRSDIYETAPQRAG